MANVTVDFDVTRRVDFRNDVVDHVVYKDRLNVTKVSHTDEILFRATRDSIVYSGLPVWKNLRRISPTKIVVPSSPPPPPLPVISKKHWRIYVTATTVADYVSAQEIEMTSTVGGANICTGGAPISSGALGGYPLSNAFDGNRGGDVGQCWVSPSTTMPQWIGYSFAGDTAVASVIWVNRTWANSQTPKDFQVQYADDVGGPWTTIATFTGVTWSSAGQAQEFSW